MIFDDSATLIMHPTFDETWTPQALFLGRVEPEIAEILVKLNVLNIKSGADNVLDLSVEYNYEVDFSSRPINGSFTGLHRGNYNLVRVPETNLGFLIVTDYENRGSTGYCGLLQDTCRHVEFPRSENMDFGVCNPDVSYYQVDAYTLGTSHTRGMGVPNSTLGTAALNAVGSNSCPETTELAQWIIITLSVLGCIVALVLAYFAFIYFVAQLHKEEAEDAAEPLVVRAAPASDAPANQTEVELAVET